MQYSDIILALAVVTVVGMLIIPLPDWLLDVLITINISIALTVLLVSMYILEPLHFSAFPSLLLIATLFRLGLNVSATRLILLHAQAGKVIESFGQFVVGGNYVVGVVVFIILIVIQFVVITNGAGRVAEVAARFTLDAMPGKQMSIDADLNAGLVTEDEARRRRKTVELEADFYGAMDGASKFVKGDAIAGIIIIFINIMGGLVIGVLQHKMDFIQALQTYTLLTVGDGLVSQIPALLISTATGIIVTRAASESNLGRDLAGQILTNPRALAIVSVILFLLGLVPGLPKLPFFIIGSVLGGVAYVLHRNIQAEQTQALEVQPDKDKEALASDPESVVKLMQVDPMELEIGYGLIPLVDTEQGGNLLGRISLIRRQIALDMGIVIPTVRIRDNLQLDANTYAIKLRGVEVARGDVRTNRYLAMNPGATEEALEGIPTREPTFGLPALWIAPEEKDRAEMLGYSVVDPSAVITTHLTEVIKNNAPVILSRQDVQMLINHVKAENPAVVDELLPELVTIGDIQKVLQNLLRERVSIRDLVTILETIANHARSTRDPELLSELSRQALSRSICSQYADATGTVHVITLTPQLQQLLSKGLHQDEQGLSISLDPGQAQRLLQHLAQEMEKMAATGYQPLLLCLSKIRLPLKKLAERSLPNLVVLAYSEIAPQFNVRAISAVSLGDED
ncbi:MAG: flagellar biosynthesis protein FlhA [Bacteroidetes bacterium]|nr:flagellar biosynthesis protein FlhA [Bacteroidota bacterium]MCL5027293.1 flagellar biosynthesis protein FlhA [Chloroflexota bacterium]